MGSDIEHWKRCLVSSIQLFCRNFCQYNSEAKIDGIIAITLDKQEVILVKLHETNGSETCNKVRSANPPCKEQSDQLQSILQYLAPSCRLLKKALVKPTASQSFSQVWKPVTNETPNQEAFVRSLGLLPISQVVSKSSTCRSSVERLKTSYDDTAAKTHHSQPHAKSSALKNMNVNGEIENHKKGDTSGVKSLKPSPKSQQTYVKLDPKANEKLRELKNAGQINRTKLKMPLATSLAMNCNTDVRVCLDVKSVNLLMREQAARRLSKNTNKLHAASEKVVQCSSKRRFGCSTGQRNVFNSTKKQSKADLDSLKRKKESAASSQNLRKRTNRKQKRVEAPGGPTSNKKQFVSRNGGEQNSKAVHKVVCQQKKSEKSKLMAEKMKKQLASKTLLNKTKVCRLKKIFGKKSVSRNNCSRVRMVCCGTCSGCRTLENCRVCTSCKDMKAYGGPNRLHQKCRLRLCRALKKEKKVMQGKKVKKSLKSCRTAVVSDEAKASSSV